LLNGDLEKCLSFVALVGEVLGISEELSEVHKFLVNEHSGNFASQVSESLFDIGIDGITNEVLPAFRVGLRNCLKISHVHLGHLKQDNLLVGLLAVVSLRVVSVVAASAASATTVIASVVVVLVVGVALLIATLVSTVVIVPTLVAVAALILIGEAHQCLNNLLGGSVLSALSLLILFVLGDPHFNLNGLGGSEKILAIKSLDSLLSISNGIVQDVSVLGLDLSFAVFLD
jgi:hypothetical protein